MSQWWRWQNWSDLMHFHANHYARGVRPQAVSSVGGRTQASSTNVFELQDTSMAQLSAMASPPRGVARRRLSVEDIAREGRRAAANEELRMKGVEERLDALTSLVGKVYEELRAQKLSAQPGCDHPRPEAEPERERNGDPQQSTCPQSDSVQSSSKADDRRGREAGRIKLRLRALSPSETPPRRRGRDARIRDERQRTSTKSPPKVESDSHLLSKPWLLGSESSAPGKAGADAGLGLSLDGISGGEVEAGMVHRGAGGGLAHSKGDQGTPGKQRSRAGEGAGVVADDDEWGKLEGGGLREDERHGSESIGPDRSRREGAGAFDLSQIDLGPSAGGVANVLGKLSEALSPPAQRHNQFSVRQADRSNTEKSRWIDGWM
mmetsp:Transcript_35573/g.71255  ORF Transcript_35573/g.71255 Transcript_35573/m.71255 type:complete len:377 (+) Transcript_35573:2238-3368(+)